MKKINLIYLFTITAFLFVCSIITVFFLKSDKSKLSYDYDDSMFDEFYIEGDYVILKNDIKVRNNTTEGQDFYLYADVSKDMGLVKDKHAYACVKASLEKEEFQLEPKSEQVFTVYLKTKKGSGNTKADRLPPDKVYFEMIK